MIAYDFERTLRDRMKARAAEFDRTVGQAPRLRTLLADERPAERPKMFGRFRLALAVATVAAATAAVLALALMSGSPTVQRLPATSPLSSVTPSPVPAITLTPSPSPSPSPSLSLSPGDDGLWGRGGGALASILP